MRQPNQLDFRALAGLLHDIGKFALRAGHAGDRVWDEWARSESGYKHAMVGASVVARIVPAQWRAEVAEAVAKHHRPMTENDRILQRADRLSGAEGDSGEGNEAADAMARPLQLLSVFSVLARGDGSSPALKYLPLASLGLEGDRLFAGEAMATEAAATAYGKLWTQFEEEAITLGAAHAQEGDFASYLEGLLSLMQRYTWCIPASDFGSQPDVSLYDHARTTAALAAVLPPKGEAGSAEALLVGGDLSGIQEFLYTVTARGATSALRGRSFYLQMLTEAAARFLLRALELPATNLLYVGGGNFYLVARPGDAAAVEAAGLAMRRILMERHQGDLSLAVTCVELRASDFEDGAISRRWDALRQGLNEAKTRRDADMGRDELVEAFAPRGSGGEQGGECQVCGRENDGVEPERDDAGETEVFKCALCRSLEEMGDALRTARFLHLARVEEPGSAANGRFAACNAVLGQFGMRLDLLDGAHAADLGKGSSHLLLALTDAALDDPALAPAPHVAIGRRFLVNTTPLMGREERLELLRMGSERGKESALPQVGGIKPFDLLEQQSSGIKRLGVMRMDVDNMGQLLRTGFDGVEGGAGRASLARIAGLSFTFSLFFEGRVAHIAEEVNRSQLRQGETAQRLYAIYSGGDDLFFVGSWDAVVALGVRVRADLGRYAGAHPDVHASAGIVLVGGKYPLYQAARDAGEAEEDAKAHIWWDGSGVRRTKDSISFLGEVMSWDKFGLGAGSEDRLDTVYALAHMLAEMVQSSEGERALLRLLLTQFEGYLEARAAQLRAQGPLGESGQPQTPYGPWTWRSLYYLKRMARRGGAESGQNRADALAARLRADDYRLMERLGVAARWADYVTRG